ncbi:MAG: hypothetical protein EXR99_06275 [Gemmataceae bacterium]|nr:hypothetical protein [Gemmataceae bacterium]
MKYLFSIRLMGMSAALAVMAIPWASAQVVSAPANFKTGQPPPRQAFSFQPPAPGPQQHVGYRITRLTPGFAADRAGFKSGDVIIQVGNHGFRTEDELFRAFRQSSSVSKVTYFESQTGIVKVREVRHLFARMGITGEVVPLGPPPGVGLPPGATLPPGPVFPPGTLPPGTIFPPVNPGPGR